MVLKIDLLMKKYADLTAVNSISLELEQGSIFGFIGPNGAGKTTTIKCIAGLLSYDSGTITVADRDIRRFPHESKKLIGYVPDTPFLYDKLTGKEFLYFVARIYGMAKQDIENNVKELAEILEFTDYMDLKTEEYSHGMRQRIVIASAFIHNPALVLIDEPMVGLDPKSARIVKDMFVDFRNKGGAIFVSTHTLSLAEEISDTIGIMNKGNLIYQGGIENLRERLQKKNLEDLYLEITKDD